MVPRVAKTGRSFKGAALYYLHDRKANTSERVAFTETINLPTNDPRRGFAHMIDTATHAHELKTAAGMKAGRKLEKPVYSYSLAWHPTEAPTKEQQLAAAHETLRELGLEKHQAIIVGHNDTDHRHLHVIVNRVDPETGKAKVMSKDKLKLSKWAQAYEQRHENVFCQVRVDNNEARDRGEWRKYKQERRRDANDWKRQTTAQIWQEYRAERDGAKDARKGSYDALWKRTQERIAARRGTIREDYRAQWKALYREQQQERKRHGAVVRSAMPKAPKRKKPKLGAEYWSFYKVADGRADLAKAQQRARAELSSQQTQAIQQSFDQEMQAYRQERDALKAEHKAEDAKRLDHYQGLTKRVWKDAAKPEGPKPPPAEMERPPDHERQAKPTSTEDAVRNRMQEKRDRSRGRTRRPRPR